MTDRICWHGHRVTDPEVALCPFCGVSMDNARIAAAAAAKVESERRPPGPNRSWNWLVTGLLLSLVGSLIGLASDEETGAVLGGIIGGMGAFALLVGAVGIGVYNGMLDFTERKRADRTSRDS